MPLLPGPGAAGWQCLIWPVYPVSSTVWGIRPEWTWRRAAEEQERGWFPTVLSALASTLRHTLWEFCYLHQSFSPFTKLFIPKMERKMQQHGWIWRLSCWESAREREMLYDIPHMQTLKRTDTNELICNTKQKKTHWLREQTYGCQGEWWRKGAVREFGIKMYILLYLKWTAIRELLYNTWNSAQCYVAACAGWGFGGEWMHVYVWLSPFAVHLKLSQHCHSAILQHKKLLQYKHANKILYSPWGCKELNMTKWLSVSLFHFQYKKVFKNPVRGF